MDIESSYPPDLTRLLIDTIPLLCRSKMDVLSFFQSAGLQGEIIMSIEQQLEENREGISKYKITKDVLLHINAKKEAGFNLRRSILRYVTEWEDFSVCYPDNQEKAQKSVKQICELIGIKDKATILEEIERSRQKLNYLIKQGDIHQKKKELEEIKNALTSLFRVNNPQVRGKVLEGILNRYFKASDMLVREAFTVTGKRSKKVIEQIDGVIEADNRVYLVEMKWLNEPVGVSEVSQHLHRLTTRPHASGMFISASGFTGSAIETCQEALQHKLIILCELQEIVRLLETDQLLNHLLRSKVYAAIIDKNPLFLPLSVHTNH